MDLKPARRILLIDDQQGIHDDYRKVLAPCQQPSAALDQAAADLFDEELVSPVVWEGFELDSALQGEEGLELVRRSLDEGRPYAMAFVDIRMPPGWDGVQTVCKIWEVDPEILVVICSAYSDYSWEDMVARMGRSDRFLILKKPFDNIEVRQCAMVLTERWSVSRTDVLTGLLNRRAFLGRATVEWSRSKRHDFPLACAMLDLDYFKRVNDDYGHTAGDVVLKLVARRLQAQCRASDSICRYGGEEFCVLLPHTNEEGAARWAEVARQAIAALPVTINDRSISVTASFGIAECLAGDGRIELAIDRADQALMIAKQSGRNRVVRSSVLSSPQASPSAAGSHPVAEAARAQLILSAQAIARGAVELSEFVSSQVDDPVPSAIKRISVLRESIRNLSSSLQGQHLPITVHFDSAMDATAMNVQSNTET